MSFKRRTPATSSKSTRLIPEPQWFQTGIASLDDILGGGIPSLHSFLALTPDNYSAYGDLLQKYFIAQGLHDGQSVLVFGDRALVDECMWLAKDPVLPKSVAEDKMAIAWRYESVGQYQTTVDTNMFDLNNRIPAQHVEEKLKQKQLNIVAIEPSEHTLQKALGLIRDELSLATADPLRIVLPSLASFQWGDIEPQELCRFLHSLELLGQANWLDKLGWLVDACISFNAFTADPTLTSAFPSYHGMLRIHTLPTPTTFSPPSDRSSLLRGLSASASREMGLSENNLGFKTTRKKLVIETLHLDIEGGISERRTTPATVVEPPVHVHNSAAGGPKVKIASEVLQSLPPTTPVEKKQKPKKSVGFVSEKPDLYDF
ncbi:PAXNEB protein-domain-containing protein [Auriculariales sp. MPI-PUGE-AT-0066]|nr:PAXNEB protein-domain-containing protein [Auriculariales sp. MPI-PUGE-AT-0066]